MRWMRHILVPVLFVALLAGAYATSLNLVFSKPDHIKVWLDQSKFYDHFIAYTVDRVVASVSGSPQVSEVTSDPSVIQAAKIAFPRQMIENSVNQFLDGNYAWLQGKANTPNFTINLAQPKETLATQLGQYAGNRFISLPACTGADPTQLQDLQNIDLLSTSCRPPGITAQAVVDQISQQIRSSGDFLQNANLTADTISQSLNEPQSTDASEKQPYYTRIANAPKLYKVSQITPLIAGGVALLSAAGLIFFAPLWRKGVRQVGVVFVLAGIVLLIGKLLFDAVYNYIEPSLTDTSNAGQLQSVFIDVFHRAERQLVKIDLWFGIGFIITACVLFSVLLATRKRTVASDDKPPISEVPAAPAQPKPPRLIQ